MVLILLSIVGLALYMSHKNGASGIVAPTETEVGYVEPWQPYPFTVFNGEGHRSAQENRKVIQQFKVATNPRYTPRDALTYCNIFAGWDYTCAMGCEIPHWVDVFGNKVPVGNGSELTANKISDWLNTQGASRGWREVTEFEARRLALEGKPTIVTWKNPFGNGHQAVVFPNSDTTKTYIAQAGAICFENGLLSRGFGKQENLQFWSHD